MRLWRELSIGERIALTFMIVLAILLALALFGYLTGGWEDDPAPTAQRFGLASAESKPEFCVHDEATRERLRGILLDALDEALHDQIKNLFMVWLKDERGQPERARIGARQAMQAHQQARLNTVEWMPPICSG